VALKVSVAELSPGSNEAKHHSCLSSGSDQHGGKIHTVELFRAFSRQGPNGRHDCLVTELLGPSVATAAERFKDGSLPGRMAWQAVRQVTKALAYIHDRGIVHGGEIEFWNASLAIA
jgi:serine/threonine protein kinase